MKRIASIGFDSFETKTEKTIGQSFKTYSNLFSTVPLKVSLDTFCKKYKWLQEVIKNLKQHELQLQGSGEKGELEIEVLQDSKLISLQRLGYIFASQILNTNSSEIWDSIRNIESFPLIEQLCIIQGVTEINHVNPAISLFAIEEAKKGVLEFREKETTHLLGIILFYIYKDPVSLEKMLLEHNEDKWIAILNKKFDEDIDKAKTQLRNKLVKHVSVNLQNAAKVSEAETAIAITSFLLCKTGYINFGIIPAIRKHFLKNELLFTPYKRHMCQVLSAFKKSPALREKILFIKGVDYSNEIAYDWMTIAKNIVKITARIPEDTEIKDLEVKKAIFITLLSQFKTDKTQKSLFRNALIQALERKPERYISDLIDLLSKGSIERYVHGIKVEIPIEMPVSRNEMNVKVKINRDGYLLTGGYLWESPALIAAAQRAGISSDKLKDAVLYIANTNIKDKWKLDFYENHLLKIFIEIVCLVKKNQLTTSEIESCTKLGCYSYESVSGNLLNECWHEALTKLSVAHILSKLKRKLWMELQIVLMDFIQKKAQILGKKTPTIDLLASLKGEFIDQIEFEYDKDGIFCSPKHTTSFQSANTSDRFQLIIKLLLNAVEFQGGFEWVEEEFNDYIASDEFLIDIQKNYSSNPPWYDKRKIDPLEIINSYFQLSDDLPITISQEVFSPLELLKSLIISGQKKIEFPTIESDILNEVWDCKIDALKWIEERFYCLVKEVVEQPLDYNEIQSIIDFALQYIKEEDFEIVDIQIGTISKKTSLNNFFEKVLSIITIHAKPSAPTISKISKALTQYICVEALSEKKRELLYKTAIPFRERVSENKAVDLCFFFNPIQSRIELWEVENSNPKIIQ